MSFLFTGLFVYNSCLVTRCSVSQRLHHSGLILSFLALEPMTANTNPIYELRNIPADTWCHGQNAYFQILLQFFKLTDVRVPAFPCHDGAFLRGKFQISAVVLECSPTIRPPPNQYVWIIDLQTNDDGKCLKVICVWFVVHGLKRAHSLNSPASPLPFLWSLESIICFLLLHPALVFSDFPPIAQHHRRAQVHRTHSFEFRFARHIRNINDLNPWSHGQADKGIHLCSVRVCVTERGGSERGIYLYFVIILLMISL